MSTDATSRSLVRKGMYRDSVELMRVAATLEKLPSVVSAAALMGTPANLALLREAGLADASLAAGPADLVIAVAGSDEAIEAALEQAELLLKGAAGTGVTGERAARQPRTIRQAVEIQAGLNLAMISTPGPYAAAEALKALKQGLHVFLFSDNVSLDAEIRLKLYARARGLLVMGPDCGTAIINGVPLGFANVVRPGAIGFVSASGTGLQEVSTLIDSEGYGTPGAGVSQAIGVGSHDLHARVGGAMMLAGLELLERDEATRVIVLISKPPDPAVAQRVIEAAAQGTKPVVACFMDGERSAAGARVQRVGTLWDAGQAAIAACAGRDYVEARPGFALGRHPELAPGNILGLFSGGTLLHEAHVYFRDALRDSVIRCELIDLGDDQYTVGRPHPMIDPRDRAARIRAAATDPEIRVILLDVVLGHGAHPDPASILGPAITEAREQAAEAGHQLHVIVSLCGARGDPQGYDAQAAAFARAGAFPQKGTLGAAHIAATFARGGDGD